MGYLPSLTETSTGRVLTETFYGYDHNLRAADGTWFDEIGLSAGSYPLFSVRPRRGRMAVGNTNKIIAMVCRDKLAWIENDGSVWYDGQRVGVDVVPGNDLQLVSMGAYLCVFPDGVYFNTHDITDCGHMGNRVEITGNVKLTMCSADGTEYDTNGAPVQRTEPENPKNGDYWIDSSDKVHVLKRYSGAQAQWVSFTTVYVRIAAAGIGAGFREQDAVRISGMHVWGAVSSVFQQVETLNSDLIIQKCEQDAIIVVGVLDRAVEINVNDMVVERRMPQLDYVCELDNRLWGCRYGNDHGENVNTIYACALGDCRNWFRYAGISTDSYAVNVGSDGQFTGICAYGGYVLAWKDNCLHKVYGTLPSNYTVTTTPCRGVAPGCGRSLAVVNEYLYYLSRNGVCVYDGSLPKGVSDVFAGARFSGGIAGVNGSVYVICMHADDGIGEAGRKRPEAAMMTGDGHTPDFAKPDRWQVWTFDAGKSIWHHAFDAHAVGFTNVENDLVMLTDGGEVWSLNGTYGEKEPVVEFDAISGIISYEYSNPDYPDQSVNKKYMSRFVLRVKMGEGDMLEVLTKYDSEGMWESQGEIRVNATGSFTLPVIPRRCDHMQIRLRGRGDVRVFSIARVLEVGSDA